MKFKELKNILNRHSGRHDHVGIWIGLKSSGVIEMESEILDFLDDYDVSWIASGTIGRNQVTNEEEPCIEIHLKERKNNDDRRENQAEAE